MSFQSSKKVKNKLKKKEKKKAITLKASQEVSEEENNGGSSDDDVKIAMLTRNFNRFLKRKHPSRTRDFIFFLTYFF